MDYQGTTIKQRWLLFYRSTFSVYTQVSLLSFQKKDTHSTPTVPSTSQLLVLSPFTPSYTIHNSHLNVSTTVRVVNFNPLSVNATIPTGVAAYVANVTINGEPAKSRCHFDFYDTFKKGGEIVIELTEDKEAVDNCAGDVPESLSTGGFVKVR